MVDNCVSSLLDMSPLGMTLERARLAVGKPAGRALIYFFLCLRLAFVFVLGFFAFVQPVTVIGVLSCISAPFCPSNAVGIFSVLLHKLPLAARAESEPSGSVSSKLPTGASGTVAKVLLVIPALLMNVSPCR